MKNYIVFDLEWNQSPHGKERSVEDLPFEIIEIGAVKLDENFRQADTFHRLICPQVYTQMHYMISEVTHMNMEELKRCGESFPKAAEEFISWCRDGADEVVYCSWGSMDLTELQRNFHYYGMENPFPDPLFYYDVQKLFGLFYRDGEKPSLDTAVEALGLLEDRPFHRALDDAYYTGKILQQLAADPGEERFGPYWSIDYYRLPADKKSEIRMTFPGYSKYVSRIFDNREEAMKDKGVTEMMCYRCGRMLRKKIRWFTPNQKIYFALACCPEHGYMKGKIRLKRVDDDRVFVVRTLKLTDDEGAGRIMERKEEVRRKRAQRNRAKKRKQQEEENPTTKKTAKKNGKKPGNIIRSRKWTH